MHYALGQAHPTMPSFSIIIYFTLVVQVCSWGGGGEGGRGGLEGSDEPPFLTVVMDYVPLEECDLP